MSKYALRMKARVMRRKGISVVVISRKLSVSKGSVSKWCRDIILTEDQLKKLTLNSAEGAKRGQILGAEANKNKRLAAIKSAEIWGKDLVKKVSLRELLLVSTALYWCEGSKSDRTSGFIFVNSDPDMVNLMKKFLTQVLKVPVADIVCSIQINKIHESRIETVLSFWKKLLKLPGGQLRKPYYVNTKISKIYENHDHYYGICRLMVRRGMNLKYRMLGLIKAIKDEILPA